MPRKKVERPADYVPTREDYTDPESEYFDPLLAAVKETRVEDEQRNESDESSNVDNG